MTNEINKNSKEYQLAYEIAEVLEDLESMDVYLTITSRLNESVCRKLLHRVMTIPEDKIKRTRGALFTYLAKQNGGFGYRH